MSESIAKQLISAVSASWNEQAPSLLGCSSTLSLLASREVSGDGMAAALAVAMTWSTAFAVSCSGAGSGVLIFLFKDDECEEIDRLAKEPADGLPRPGGRALIQSVLEGVATNMGQDSATAVSFSPSTFINLAINETRLAAIVKETAHIGTFSLSVGDDINSQALMLYAPNGSLEQPAEVKGVSNAKPVAMPTATNASDEQNSSGAPQQAGNPSSHNGTRRNSNQRRNEVGPRNIERLLDVELDVVARFGITSVPLRDVVRMGVGTMIELNRAVDEPVELLVNGRQLARGEVVVVDGYYGVRITEIGPASERSIG